MIKILKDKDGDNLGINTDTIVSIVVHEDDLILVTKEVKLALDWPADDMAGLCEYLNDPSSPSVMIGHQHTAAMTPYIPNTKYLGEPEWSPVQKVYQVQEDQMCIEISAWRAGCMIVHAEDKVLGKDPQSKYYLFEYLESE